LPPTNSNSFSIYPSIIIIYRIHYLIFCVKKKKSIFLKIFTFFLPRWGKLLTRRIRLESLFIGMEMRFYRLAAGHCLQAGKIILPFWADFLCRRLPSPELSAQRLPCDGCGGVIFGVE
jgi:hypothetical protein